MANYGGSVEIVKRIFTIKNRIQGASIRKWIVAKFFAMKDIAADRVAQAKNGSTGKP